ncbi:MAG TPA: hypothetical protein VMP11_12025 [Verrucomicrobiae bacterium]|nr:hypothetical protein [Verrucomicrobiae bacterium]
MVKMRLMRVCFHNNKKMVVAFPPQRRWAVTGVIRPQPILRDGREGLGRVEVAWGHGLLAGGKSDGFGTSVPHFSALVFSAGIV